MRRVGGLVLRLLAVIAFAAASVAAAVALLGGDLGPASEDEPSAATSDPVTSEADRPALHKRAEAEAPQAAPLFRAGAGASWRELARSLPGEAGLVVAPLGGGPVRSFGSLRGGHAWSTIKVPILVTLLRERGARGLSVAEEGSAGAALTASDNEAAALLFAQIESARGGLVAASQAVEQTLRDAGDASTVVATAPPPPGAVSTYGQTEWSLGDSASFFRALAQGCLLDRADTDYVLDLMEEVVPEQRWGLGEAGFPAEWRVALKGGWGPEGSASGPYLVRQVGIVREGDSGVTVALMAQADSGSFDAGVEAIDRIAEWLAESLAGLGRRGAPCKPA